MITDVLWRPLWTPFFLLLLAIARAPSAAGQPSLVFDHLTVENGLSSVSVLGLAQDHRGFIWIGTMDGLNRYDGSRVKIYRSFYRDNPFAQSIKIHRLLADRQDRLWIGTNHGLYLYHAQADSFQRLSLPETDETGRRTSSISALYQDRKGTIWIGTENGLLQQPAGQPPAPRPVALVDGAGRPCTRTVQALRETSAGQLLIGTDEGLFLLRHTGVPPGWSRLSRQLASHDIAALAEDHQQNLWIGTVGSGVFRADKDFFPLGRYLHRTGATDGLVSNTIRKIITDRKGRTWIGTLKGLNVYEPATGRFQSYVHQPGNPRSLNFNSIYDLLEDRQGNVWAGTYFGGVNICEALTTRFTAYQSDGKENSISSDLVRGIAPDSAGNLWVGTEAEGLNYFDRKTGRFTHFNHDENDSASLNSNLVKAILRDRRNRIWVGLHTGGLDLMLQGGRRFRHITRKNTRNALRSDNITALIQDRKGTLWIGTETNGISLYNDRTGRMETFESAYPGLRLSNPSIICLFEDSKRNVWIGTKYGLNRLDSSGRQLTTFTKKEHPRELRSDFINCISEGQRGRVWIGTNLGLCYFDLDSGQRRLGTLPEAGPLADKKVMNIVVDSGNYGWITTDLGLYRIDKARWQLTEYTTDDGLPGNVFNNNSSYRAPDGRLFFGAFKGLVSFHPAEIEMNRQAPEIQLTGLRINGHPVTARDSLGLLQQEVAQTGRVILDHNQNMVSVDYAVLNFIKPRKNRSAYRLQGYDDHWTFPETPTASFTNLPPGRYTLLLLGSNNDGVWTQTPRKLQLTILPPPWKTWWAYATYAFTLALAFYGIYSFLASRAELQRRLKYEQLVNQQQQELHRMKMDFFTHVSHEIRTPLTLILAPLEMLLTMAENASALHQKLLQSVRTNADRLLQLTNDLLNFRKADAGHMQLKVRRDNLVAFARSVHAKFTAAATGKSLAYTFAAEEEVIEVWFDPGHLEIVLSNLLSNALKFTPEQGKVVMQVTRKNGDSAEIRVCDNGPGIPPESQEKIFTHFYQASSRGNKNPGSGIGLAFSKSLVELHQGTLHFQSGPNPQTGMQETCFFVTLQLGKKHFEHTNVLFDQPILP
ncbi:two-component regulator propeller domain-containing protein [Paraflavisolibacter sp. H34]|uniref:ligand-binding sensor domain-containing protein n=1 Tax=Huijunlia imazamoxiresistens TaxID=3127457 RepID=UPI00301AA6B3